jgi:predicted solute-binding protein
VAGPLLHQKENVSSDVHLHLLCQGLENIQKSLLLARNYDAYRKPVRQMRHNLILGSETLRAAYSLKPLRPQVQSTLEKLNSYYSAHLFRYSGIHDVFGVIRNVDYEPVVRRALALYLFGKRIFARVAGQSISDPQFTAVQKPNPP